MGCGGGGGGGRGVTHSFFYGCVTPASGLHIDILYESMTEKCTGCVLVDLCVVPVLMPVCMFLMIG